MAISVNISAPGAIPDLDGLKEWIADEVDRDLSEISGKLDKHIQMAEALFNRELRTQQMEDTAIGTATTEDTVLPEDYLAMRSVYVEGSPDRPLRALSPSSVRQESDGTTGTPEAYILIAGGIRLVPPPAEEMLLTMDYYAMIPPLSVYAPSNWLLRQHPDLYVYATLFHYYRWAGNRDAAADAAALRDDLIAKLNRSATADRYGAGPLARSTTRQVAGGRC